MEMDTHTENRNASRDHVQLKRNVSLVGGVSFVVGTSIGSGIFVSPKGVLLETKSVGLSLVVWVCSGIFALFGALCYTELGTLIPKSGAEYSYFAETTIPVVAFLFAWTKVLIIQPSDIAITCMTFATYFVSFFDFCGSSQSTEKIVASLVILTVCIINSSDTKWASGVQMFFTGATLLSIAVIIIGGCVRMGQGGVNILQFGFEGTTTSPSNIALAFYDALWAYSGWNTLNYLTEELKNPFVNLPRANIVGVSLVTIIYLLTNISYLVVLSADGVLHSSAVAVDWGQDMLGDGWFIMPITVILSTFGSANGVCFSSGRLVYAAGREGHLPEVLSYVHVKRYTPLPSIVFTCTVAIILVIVGDIGPLINFFSFASWLFYGMAGFCVIILRFTRRDAERKFKVFILIPIVFVLVSVYLVIGPIIEDPQIEILYAFTFISGGLVFYFTLVVFSLHKGYFDYFTTFIQLLCQVAPSPYRPDED